MTRDEGGAQAGGPAPCSGHGTGSGWHQWPCDARPGQSDEGLRSFHEVAAASPRLSCPALSEASRVAGRQLSDVATLDPATKPCGDRRRNGRSGGHSSFARLPWTHVGGSEIASPQPLSTENRHGGDAQVSIEFPRSWPHTVRPGSDRSSPHPCRTRTLGGSPRDQGGKQVCSAARTADPARHVRGHHFGFPSGRTPAAYGRPRSAMASGGRWR